MAPRAQSATEQHLVIVGGGIAGLAAALRARKLNADCRVTVIDATGRFGGKIDGEMVAGCVVDGGADVCIGAKLRATHLFRDLDLGSRVIPVNPNGLPTYEKRDGALQPSPTTFADELLTFREGMRELTDAACAALSDVTAITNAPIESLATCGSRWQVVARDGASHLADAVIGAIPAEPTAQLLLNIAPAAATSLSELEYPPTTTVTFAWRAEDVVRILDGTGYIVTDPSSPLSAVTWTSSKNPSHAPPGIVLVRGYVRGTACDAAAIVLAECSNMLGVTAPPIFMRSYEWPAGIPLYRADHEARVRALEQSLCAAHGLFIAGSPFHGVGVPDCISSGERAAAAAVSFLASANSRQTA